VPRAESLNWAVDSVDISRRIFSLPDTSFRESQFYRIIVVRVLNHCISISTAPSYLCRVPTTRVGAERPRGFAVHFRFFVAVRVSRT
jgi:hypothetical protein